MKTDTQTALIPLESIPACWHVKRALEVAAVAQTVTVALVGHPLGESPRLARTALAAESETVATLSRCQCGNYGDPAEECTCYAPTRQTLLRPFAMVVEVPRVSLRDQLSKHAPEPEETILARVMEARTRRDAIPATPGDMDAYSREILEQAQDTLNFHSGEVRQILTLAQAIAALDSAPRIQSVHLLEAIQYKAPAVTLNR